MSLYRYNKQCAALAEELTASVSTADSTALYADLSGMARRDWWRWRDAHEETVADFVRATPTQRGRRVAWRPDRLRLTLAGIQYCLEAQALLTVANQLQPGLGYRQMAAQAGQLYQQMYDVHIPDWPFPGQSPFPLAHHANDQSCSRQLSS